MLRRLLPLLLVAAFCACTDGKGPSAQDEEPSADARALPPSTGWQSARKETSERQQLVNRELKYYLDRHNPLDEGFDIVARYAEEGESRASLYLPPGRLSVGQVLSPHWGKGATTDAQGRLVVGHFQADTLFSGLRIDSAGFYAGTLNHRGEATGHGIYRTADGTYYEGHWEHDQREGFGLSIGPGHLKVGAWLRDHFRGERMSYHSDRIYGIDISRYQHERGRRRYPIQWNRLRIVHLSRRISQERVVDNVNYPVSFVYIKTTEGTTIENRYYDADDAAARHCGLHVGAYHFLSTTTPPDDQARHFLEHANLRRGDLPPMLDIEPSDKQIDAMGGPPALFQSVRTWLHIVEQASGVRPLLYINQRFANLYLPEAPDLKQDYHFWIARYGEYKPDIHLDIWQLSGDGRVQGIVPEVDINVFNGYQGQWDEFLRTQTIP